MSDDSEPLDDKFENAIFGTPVYRSSDVAAAVSYEHQLITTRLVSKLKMMGVEQEMINAILNTIETCKKDAFPDIVDKQDGDNK